MSQVRLDLNSTSSAILPQRKEPEGYWGLSLAELKESLAVTSKSRRLGNV